MLNQTHTLIPAVCICRSVSLIALTCFLVKSLRLREHIQTARVSAASGQALQTVHRRLQHSKCTQI